MVRGLFLSLPPGVWKFHTFKCYFLWRLANISSSDLLLTAMMSIISLGSWSWMSVSVTIRMNDTDYFIHRWLAMLPLLNTSRENGTCPTHSGIIQLTTEYKHHQKTQQNFLVTSLLFINIHSQDFGICLGIWGSVPPSCLTVNLLLPNVELAGPTCVRNW